METDVAGAENVLPFFLKVCRSVANAFSACALVPLKEM
jgi:hypothetical protein